jgi:hypothetical protein
VCCTIHLKNLREAQILRFSQSKLLIDEFGHTLPVEKLAKVPVKGIFPPMVNPAAIPIMFASAIQFGKNVCVFS